jgi:hypothetical protein
MGAIAPMGPGKGGKKLLKKIISRKRVQNVVAPEYRGYVQYQLNSTYGI